jgi:aminoglycoside phosphotransferase (APT) family kinase protein
VQRETAEIRPGERVDEEALRRYLQWHLTPDRIPGLDFAQPMQVSQFPGGHSNLTYLIRIGGAELVLRRPPLGPVPPKAHDMAREYRRLTALHPVFPLAPRTYALCDDPGVLGSVFYVMERRRGIVVRHEEPMPLVDQPDARRRVSEALIDALADLHAVDVTRAPLADMGKPAGFVLRQIQGWSERWHKSRLTDIPEMDAVAAWLVEHLPPDTTAPTVVHGDFKLDNLLLDPLDVGRVVAIFDWEMSALGDPLVDLGILLAYWAPTAPPGQRDALTTVTTRPGYLSKTALVERYAQRSGRDVSAIAFFETFALFKIAVVIQQIYFRFKRGQTADPRFSNFGERVVYLARQATTLSAPLFYGVRSGSDPGQIRVRSGSGSGLTQI